MPNTRQPGLQGRLGRKAVLNGGYLVFFSVFRMSCELAQAEVAEPGSSVNGVVQIM